jgi:hypothetical protein
MGAHLLYNSFEGEERKQQVGFRQVVCRPGYNQILPMSKRMVVIYFKTEMQPYFLKMHS